MKPFIARKTIVLDFPEYFETIQRYPLERQKAEIDSYNNLSRVYVHFIQWYCRTDFRQRSRTYSYRQNHRRGVDLIDCVGNLMRITAIRDPMVQKREFERFMESLEPANMMIMENAFSKSLEMLFPKFDWDYLKLTAGIVKKEEKEDGNPETV